MFIEKRKVGKSTKYYLVHSYRDKDNKVKKIRKYLGSNLSKEKLSLLRKKGEKIIRDQIEELKTEIFNFFLSEKEIEKLNKLSEQIHISHLNLEEWKEFTEDFVYNTNAIEGSTISQDEVPKILKKEKVYDPEEIETKGLAKAVNLVRITSEDLSLPFIKKLHKLCFEGSKEFAGRFRDKNVVILNSRGEVVHRGTPTSELDKTLNEFISWYRDNKKKFSPLVMAAIVHNQFEHIHPFQDGNGRVGRLLLNFILIKNKYPPINILLKDRGEYYLTLRKYSNYGDLKPTIHFLIKQYKKTLKKVSTKTKK